MVRIDFCNEEYTTVFTYDRKRQILEIDRTWSGVQRDVVCTRKLQITDDRQNLKLRFILDRSSIDLFINDGSKTDYRDPNTSGSR